MKKKAFTLVELIIVVGILAVTIGSAVVFFMGGLSVNLLVSKKVDIVQNARVAINKMVVELRMARASTIVISQNMPGHPEYKKIAFTDIDGDISYFFCSALSGAYTLYYKKDGSSPLPLTDGKDSASDKYYVNVKTLEFEWNVGSHLLSIYLVLSSPPDVHGKSRRYEVRSSVWVRNP
ncbi:MAG: type II secretion system protein [Synergistetes bacterium]|nr:type II secretion system protein [Synergistota bacterium]